MPLSHLLVQQKKIEKEIKASFASSVVRSVMHKYFEVYNNLSEPYIGTDADGKNPAICFSLSLSDGSENWQEYPSYVMSYPIDIMDKNDAEEIVKRTKFHVKWIKQSHKNWCRIIKKSLTESE